MGKTNFVHARTFETCWGIGLAFIDLPDDRDAEVLKLQIWASVAEDGSLGKVAVAIGLSDDASDEAHEIMEVSNRKALVEMTVERFEAVLDQAGVGKMLDGLPDADE